MLFRSLADVGTDAPTPMKAPELRAWALKRLAEIAEGLEPGNAPEALRQVVQAYVVRIDIDGKAKRGTLWLPADALAILERDAASISRVKPADAGFDAIKAAFLGGTTLELAVLDQARETAGAQGPKGSFAITGFSRSEALEEAIMVSVTAKLAEFDEWVQTANP